MPFDRKILQDREHYADSLEIQMGDMKISLGDLRAYDAEQSNAAQQAQERARGYESQYAQTVDQYNRLQAQYEEATTRANGLTTDPNAIVDLLIQRLTGDKNPNVLDKPGEFFKPLIDRVNEIESLKASHEQSVKAMRDEIKQAFSFQVAKDMKRDYRSFDWPKEMPFEKAVQYAQQRGLVERDTGYPDFDRIHEEVMGPAKAAAHEKELAERFRKEGYDKAREEYSQQGAIVPTPGFGGPPPAVKGKYGGVEKISEQDILNDAEVWTQNIPS